LHRRLRRRPPHRRSRWHARPADQRGRDGGSRRRGDEPGQDDGCPPGEWRRSCHRQSDAPPRST